MNKPAEIIVFSHLPGKIEKIEVDDFQIESDGEMRYVIAIDNSMTSCIIPWNRVKQINIKILNNESEEN